MTALLENLADGVVPADSAAPRRRARPGPAPGPAGRRPAPALPARGGRGRAGPPATVAVRALVEDVRRAGARRRPDRRRSTSTSPTTWWSPATRPGCASCSSTSSTTPARHAPAETAVRDHGRRRRPTGWWLEVADDGGGVAPEDRERVFERFGTDGAGGAPASGSPSPAGWPSSTAARSASSTPRPGSGARLRLEVPTGAACADPTARHPVARAGGRHDPDPRPSPPACPTRVPPTTSAPPGLDALFGRFWPERRGCRRAAHRRRRARGRARRRRRPVLHRARHHLDARRRRVRRRRTAHRAAPTRAVDHRCARRWPLLLVLPLTLLDAVVDPDARALRGRRRVPVRRHRRPHPARHPARPASPGRCRRCAACRGSAARCGSPAPGRARRPSCGPSVWSLLGLGVFGTIFASANPVFGSWVDAARAQPDLQRPRRPGLPRPASSSPPTLGAAYLALNPADVEVLGGRRPTPLANRFEWLVPVLRRRRGLPAFIAAQARPLVGGRDYIEATTGLTYADYVHQGFGQLTLATALTVLVVWVAVPPGGRRAEDRRWLLGSARAALRAHPAGGRRPPCAA